MLDEKQWQEMIHGLYQGDAVFNRPMREITGLCIGGPADVMVTPDDPISVKNLLMLLKKKGIPFLTIGGGTNLLVRDKGIDGVVVSLRQFRRIEVLKEENETVELFAEAGVPLQKLVNFCREKGYSGIEGLAGIPGTLGGAIFGNSGSYGTEIRDVLESVAIMDGSGRLGRFRPEGLGLTYRGSSIGPTDLILSANIRMKRDEKEAVASRTDAFLAEKKKTQPIGERSAGCVFKNPPEGPPAGKLIDEAGCKGLRMGSVEVSAVHANFFINTGNGTADDYLSLMQEVSYRVQQRFNVTLEPEVRVVGRA